ncbi:hypothetical protein PRIPAC_92234 [Pristionchus pacificus]|uniref:Uncharacterized protein n=1 Tax=Pristionchus pacificus TaxID=54126 RepID=A0A2A6BQQ4_PRIPA|nr:hypothetical protein PRIPAC_92234 [Pristionchus pacificus]|eukprot:PDM68249.1 hypothetical protein PRIPAC_46293 [Pristionchus pacificus]
MVCFCPPGSDYVTLIQRRRDAALTQSISSPSLATRTVAYSIGQQDISAAGSTTDEGFSTLTLSIFWVTAVICVLLLAVFVCWLCIRRSVRASENKEFLALSYGNPLCEELIATPICEDDLIIDV